MAKFKTYSISTDTASAKLDPEALHAQMMADATVGEKFDGVNRTQGENSFDCYLVVERTAEIDTAMDAIIAAHDGVALTAPAAEVVVTRQDSAAPFANKILANGQKLYRRKHGIKLDDAVVSIAVGETKTLSLVMPYNNAKIDKLEIIGGRVGDTIDLKVYDTPTGTISATLAATGYTAIPNLMLNQFGFGVYICGPFYEDHSNYDADLIKDMNIELSYTNNHTTDVAIPFANIVLHEVK